MVSGINGILRIQITRQSLFHINAWIRNYVNSHQRFNISTSKRDHSGYQMEILVTHAMFFCTILSHYHGLFNSTILDLYVDAYVGPQRFTYYSKHTTLMRGTINSKLFIFLIKFVFSITSFIQSQLKIKMVSFMNKFLDTSPGVLVQYNCDHGYTSCTMLPPGIKGPVLLTWNSFNLSTDK